MPVKTAQEALAILKNEISAEDFHSYKGLLPGYALRLEKNGKSISKEILIEAARKGIQYLKSPLVQISAKAQTIKKEPLTLYQEVLATFSPPERYNIVSEEKTLQQQLYTACIFGNFARVWECHRKGADIRADNDRALQLSAQYGYLPLVKYFHSHGGDIRADSDAALRWSVQNGRLPLLKYLHKHGADIRIYNDSLLREAANQGYLPLVKYLHKHGLKVNTSTIRWVAAQGHLNIVKYLHQAGNNIQHAADIALCEAAANGHQDVVRYLHKHGADLKNIGDSALFEAAKNGHLETVRYLHKQRVNIKSANNALFEAVSNGHLDIVKYLHSHGCNIRAEDDRAIQLAANKGHPFLVNYLFEQGASFESLNKEQQEKFGVWHYNHRKWHKTVRINFPDGLEQENPKFFKESAFKLAQELLRLEGHTGKSANLMAYAAAGLFGSEARILQYLRLWGKAGNQPLHDVIYMISLPRVGPFNVKDWGDAVLKCGPALARLVKFADKLPSPARSADGRTWSLAKTRSEVAKHVFNNSSQHPDLADLCFEHNVSEKDFDSALSLVKKGAPSIKNIPEIVIEGKKFDMEGAWFYRLPANDIRGLFLGELTDCCQSIGGAGDECTRHGWSSSEGGFYVVENARHRIIAQTWAWRGKDGEVCFDTLETLGKNVTAEQWSKILKESARQLSATKERHNVTALTVGLGGRTPDELLKSFQKAALPAIPKDYAEYRESQKQILVWQR